MSCLPLQTIARLNTYQDYKKVFNLNSIMDDRVTLLELCDGPSLFNQQMTLSGAQVVTAGPYLGASKDEMHHRLEHARDQATAQALKTMGASGCSPVQLSNKARVFQRKADLYLRDYRQSLEQGRYVYTDFSKLPFSDQLFDLALCFVPQDLSATVFSQLLKEVRRVSVACRLAFVIDDAQEVPDWFMEVMTQLSQESQVTFKPCFHEGQHFVLLCADVLSCAI